MFNLYDKKFQLSRPFKSQSDLTDWLASVIAYDDANIDDFVISKVVITEIDPLTLMAEILKKVEDAESDCEEPVEGK